MKKFFYATLCVVSLCLSGCGYDDDEVWNAINDQEERIAALEEWQKTANENIAALQAIVNGNDYITSVEEIKEGDEIIGYTINFYRQGEVTIYNGKDGEKGDMPVIGVSEGEDGRWYWTVNGELLEDADGNPVCANGKDGEDGEDGEDGADGSSSSGVTPVIKLGWELGEDYNQYASYISVDGGRTWTQITTTYGMTGYVLDAIWSSNGYYLFDFTNQDGETFSIQIPEYAGLQLGYVYQGEDGSDWYTNIYDGVLSVPTGKAFTIQCYLPSGGNLEYTLGQEENADEWKITKEEDYWNINLNFDAIENPGTATLMLTLISSNNEVTYYQVKITAYKTQTIDKEENPALVLALANSLGTDILNNEGDVEITADVIQNTTSLYLSNQNITSLEGIEAFENLEVLNCSNNPLTSLDVSAFSELRELNCDNCFNQSTSRSYSNGVLDLSENTKLQTLSCENNGLISLVLPKTQTLEEINCSNNSLTVLNLTDTPKITTLNCSENPFNSFDITCLPELRNLNCYSSFDEITTASTSVKVGVLDLSFNTMLQSVECAYNELTQLILPDTPTLTALYCYNNQLTSLDISKQINLMSLYLSANLLSQIELSSNTKLKELYCDENKLTELNIAYCIELTTLACYGNQMSMLDISNNAMLNYVACGKQYNSSNLSQQLELVLPEAMLSKWENEWKNLNENYNVIVADGSIHTSGGSGSNFGNGGVY